MHPPTFAHTPHSTASLHSARTVDFRRDYDAQTQRGRVKAARHSALIPLLSYLESLAMRVTAPSLSLRSVAAGRVVCTLKVTKL